MFSALLLFAVLSLTVYGQLMVKARSLDHAIDLAGMQGKLHYLVLMFTDVGVLSALAAAIIAGACWMVAITRLDLAFAYPFMALSFVLVPLGSALLFGEPLPKIQFLALSVIVAGVTLSALSR